MSVFLSMQVTTRRKKKEYSSFASYYKCISSCTYNKKGEKEKKMKYKMKMKNRNYIIQILTKHAMLNYTFQTAIHKHGRHTPPQSNTRRATPHRGTCHHQNVTVLLGGSPRSRNKPVRLWRWHCLPHRASSARGATVPRRRPLEEKPLITKTGLSWWNIFFCKCVCRWIRE